MTFLLILSLLIPTLLADTPALVVEIFRHGIRTPESPKYDTAKHWNTVGYGELTPAGMRQQYILGALLGLEYPELLYPYYPWDIYAQAASENRTIVSAQSQLFGIYNGTGPNITGYDIDLTNPPYNNDTTNLTAIMTNISTLTPAVPYQYSPIPVHSNPTNGDYLLLSYLNCPTANQAWKDHMKDTTVQSVFAELSDTIDTLNSSYGIVAETYSDFDDLGDLVMSNQANGYPLPGNMTNTSTVYQDLLFFTQWYEIYPVLATTTQQQVFAGPFLYNLGSLFYNTSIGISTRTFFFYAAKETMLSILLNALGIMNTTCLKANWEATRVGQPAPFPNCQYPIFASNLIFEFYNTTVPYIMVKYQGNYMSVCPSGVSCPLTEFNTLVNQVTNGTNMNTFINYCGLNLTNIVQKEPYEVAAKFGALDIVLIVVCVVLVAALGVALFKIRQMKRRVDDKYENFELKV